MGPSILLYCFLLSATIAVDPVAAKSNFIIFTKMPFNGSSGSRPKRPVMVPIPLSMPSFTPYSKITTRSPYNDEEEDEETDVYSPSQSTQSVSNAMSMSSEQQAIFYLEKAKEQFTQSVSNTIERLKNTERNLTSVLEKTRKSLVVKEHELSRCRTDLRQVAECSEALEDAIHREKRLESKVVELEATLREKEDKLRKVSGVTITGDRLRGAGGRSRANIVYKKKKVAHFRTVRYRVNDEGWIIVEEAISKITRPLSRGFSFLKLVKENGLYRLSLSNERGNQFFEHKKHNSYYSSIPEEAKTLSGRHISNADIDWREWEEKCGQWACFFLKPGDSEAAPDVFTVNGEQEIGTLDPVIAYFEAGNLVLSDGNSDTVFQEPFIETIDGRFFVKEKSNHRLSREFNLRVLDIDDEEGFQTMIASFYR